MLVNEVLSLLLEKKIYFSSDDFVRGYRTRDFSNHDLQLSGLWLLLYVKVYSDESRILSQMSPRICQLSSSGELMLYAWPFDEYCLVHHFTEAYEK